MSNRFVILSLTILPIAAAASRARATFVPLPFSYTGGAGGGAAVYFMGDSVGYVNDPTAAIGASGSNPISLNAQALLAGIQFTNNGASLYIIDWNGALSIDFFSTGDLISMNYDFTLTLSGGIADWSLSSNIGDAPELLTSGIAAPGGPEEFKGSISEILSSDIPPSANGWYTNLTINSWTGESPTDGLSISLPVESSLTLSVGAPEPSSLSLLAPTFLLLTRRRSPAK